MTLTATTADMTVTATVEMAVPTNLGDLMVTTAPIEARLTAIAAEIRVEMKRTVESVIKIGKLLLTAKELTADPKCGIAGDNPKARFGAWVCENFSHTSGDTTAQRKMFGGFMNIARTYGDRDPADLENIGLSILYELAAPSTPADTRTMIETKLQDGDNLTVKDVKGIIRDARNPAPSISAPAPSKDEDDDPPFDPSPNGEPIFVQTTPSSPSPTPAVEGNDEEEEDVQRKRGRLYAADLITDPEQKTLHDLNAAQLRITGGADFGGTTAKSFISSYMRDLNASTIFNDMQSDMSEALAKGSTLEEAREIAHQRMEAFRTQMIEIVNRVCDDGAKLFQNRTAPMDKAVKFLPKAFHQSTPPAEALTAAIMAIKCMEA